MEGREWRPLHLGCRTHSFPGILVAVEGIDGVGKTTLVNNVASELMRVGHRCVVTKAPSEELRSLPSWVRWHSDVGARANLDELGLSLMALGDRLTHQKSFVIPALCRGDIVLFDRYILSILTYWSTPAHAYAVEKLFSPDVGILCVAPRLSVRQRLLLRKEEPPDLLDDASLNLLHERYELLRTFYRYETIDTDAFNPLETCAEALAIIQKCQRGQRTVKEH